MKEKLLILHKKQFNLTGLYRGDQLYSHFPFCRCSLVSKMAALVKVNSPKRPKELNFLGLQMLQFIFKISLDLVCLVRLLLKGSKVKAHTEKCKQVNK